jgi:hypothetical protein
VNSINTATRARAPETHVPASALSIRFELDAGTVVLAGFHEQPVHRRLRSKWLFQILARLALARAENQPWVGIDDLASLDASGAASLDSAGRKLSSLLDQELAPNLYVSNLVRHQGHKKIGPYALDLPEHCSVFPGRDDLHNYICSHRRPLPSEAVSESWLTPFNSLLIKGTMPAVLPLVDAAIRRRLGEDTGLGTLVDELRAEPHAEVRALVRCLHDPCSPLAPCAPIIDRGATQTRTLLRVLTNAVLFVRTVLEAHDGLSHLLRLGRANDALSRMLAHAVLHRVVLARPEPAIRDAIFEIADCERLAHRNDFLAVDLGIQKGTYHPVLPAALASIVVDGSADLGYLHRLLLEALKSGDDPIAVRCIRDAVIGILYPSQALTTLAALPASLPPPVKLALAQTLARIQPHRGRQVAKLLRGRPLLRKLVESAPPGESAAEQVNERAWGNRMTAVLLRSRCCRRSLAQTVEDVLDGGSLAEQLDRLLPGLSDRQL